MNAYVTKKVVSVFVCVFRAPPAEMEQEVGTTKKQEENPQDAGGSKFQDDEDEQKRRHPVWTKGLHSEI
jgi:hypothetical protein